ncbi:hypothetical protein ElyMa_003082900 [Elysia marginata]|uniref:Uncharacterized protein n=1 Tax=Elysia marginata TaxID=1093978 RepID=A0AAV4ILE8_9GAST|nr:hypothetical protein ElyMa_003082900 [Elysia marginata]
MNTGRRWSPQLPATQRELSWLSLMTGHAVEMKDAWILETYLGMSRCDIPCGHISWSLNLGDAGHKGIEASSHFASKPLVGVSRSDPQRTISRTLTINNMSFGLQLAGLDNGMTPAKDEKENDEEEGMAKGDPESASAMRIREFGVPTVCIYSSLIR